MGLPAALIGWKGYALAALAGAALAAVGATTFLSAIHGEQIAIMERDWAQELDAQAQAVVTAVENARKEERRRIAAVEIARDDAKVQAAAAAADAADARAERDRLRARANALAHAASTRDPTLADGSPAGTAAVDLLAYMLRRSVDRAEILAGIADRARIAGLTCERSYDALRGR